MKMLVQLPDHLRVDDRVAAGHPPDRVDKRGDVGDPVLQQISHARVPGRVQQLGGVGQLDVLADHKDPEPGPGRAQRDGRAESLVGEVGRHPDIGEHQIRLVRRNRRAERGRVTDGRDHVEAEPGEQPADPLPDEHAVLGQHDPYGPVV